MGRADFGGFVDIAGSAPGFGVSPLAPANGGAGGTGGTGGAGGVASGGAFRGGGRGGDGGDGGAGGRGGFAGGGGAASGGSGGAFLIAATVIRTQPSATLVLGGGGSGMMAGTSGRMLYADAEGLGQGDYQSIFVLPSPAAILDQSTDFVPMGASPFFGGVMTPHIVPSGAAGAGATGLNGGAAPFGILPITITTTDATMTGAISNAPPGTVGVVIRYQTGPTGFSTAYNSLAISAGDTHDMLVMVNLSGVNSSTASTRFNGVLLQEFPFNRRTDFGGPGTTTTTGLAAGRAFAALGPESDVISGEFRVNGIGAQLTIPDAGATAVVRYITSIVACTASDVAGSNLSVGAVGTLTADDIIVFLGWFFAGDSRADVAGANQSTTPDGQFTADDIIVFLGRYFAGC
jgi:hypothetical protein